MNKSTLALIVAFLFATTVLAQSTFNPDDPIQGKYSGIIMVDGLPQPVWLEISALTPGKDGAKLRYAQPRGRVCNKWQYGGPGRDAHYFYYRGGSCVVSGVPTTILTVRLTGSGGLKYELREDKDTVVESQILTAD